MIACNEGDIRLQGSNTNGTGRVKICHNNIWGTVCDDSWSNVDAAVACNQLGLVGAGTYASLCYSYRKNAPFIYCMMKKAVVKVRLIMANIAGLGLS